MDLSVHVRGRLGGAMALSVRGDLDYTTHGRFRACVAEALQPPPGVLHIDLQLVTFLDSSGLGALVWAHQQAARVAARLVLDNLPDQVLRTFRTAGLVEFFGLTGA